MSKIAGNPVSIPEGVNISISDQIVTIKGGKGEQSHNVHPLVSVTQEGSVLKLLAVSESKPSKALAGTTRALLQNMITGVSQGFERRLEITGIGYRAQVQGTILNLTLGLSHPVNFEIPEGITVNISNQTEIVIKGYDKQKVGQVAANIRTYRPPEPYKGKGIKYTDEKIIRKEAKKS